MASKWGGSKASVSPDQSLVQLANEDGRIVTCDGLDFGLLARDYAATRRRHGGLVAASARLGNLVLTLSSTTAGFRHVDDARHG